VLTSLILTVVGLAIVPVLICENEESGPYAAARSGAQMAGALEFVKETRFCLGFVTAR
jgi:hypothetical protein